MTVHAQRFDEAHAEFNRHHEAFNYIHRLQKIIGVAWGVCAGLSFYMLGRSFYLIFIQPDFPRSQPYLINGAVFGLLIAMLVMAGTNFLAIQRYHLDRMKTYHKEIKSIHLSMVQKLKEMRENEQPR